jgi:hypothetical protein
MKRDCAPVAGDTKARQTAAQIAEELVDNYRTRNAVYLTPDRRFCRDTEILVYRDCDTRIITLWADQPDHRHAVRSKH